MKKQITYLLLVASSLTISSCTKDQKAINLLEGYWTLQYQSIGGVIDTQLHGCTWFFDKCTDSNNQWCKSLVNCYSPAFDYYIYYKIENGGKTMLTDAVGSASEREILVLDKHNFKIKNTDPIQGVIIEVYAR